MIYQVPQLWSSYLSSNSGKVVSSHRILSIAEVEAEKKHEASQKADNCKALVEAKSQGKEAHAAVKAHIAQEQAEVVQAKKLEKLKITAEQQAEKARVAAENKAKQAEKRVRLPLFITSSKFYYLSGWEVESGVTNR